MKISTKGRYALRVMLDLAINNTGEYIPLKDISVRQNMSIKYMEQIISLLKKEGFLKSTRGNGGGYRLAKLPQEYTIGDILRAAEGSLAPIACLAVSYTQLDVYKRQLRSGGQKLCFVQLLGNGIHGVFIFDGYGDYR